jgi:hypothetical protein
MQVTRSDLGDGNEEFHVRDVYIVASTNTDIPNYYGRYLKDAQSSGAISLKLYGAPASRLTVSLREGDVRGYIFYSKNYGPFLNQLDAYRGLPLRFIFTIGDAPVLRARVPRREILLSQIHALAEQFGISAVIWKIPPLMFDKQGILLFEDKIIEAARDIRGVGVGACLIENYSARFHPSEMRARMKAAGLGMVSEYRDTRSAIHIGNLIQRLQEEFGFHVLDRSDKLFDDFVVDDIENRINCIDVGRMTMPCPTRCVYCDTNYTSNFANDDRRRRQIAMDRNGLSSGLEAYLSSEALSVAGGTDNLYSPHMIELRARYSLAGVGEVIVNIVGDPRGGHRAYVDELQT